MSTCIPPAPTGPIVFTDPFDSVILDHWVNTLREITFVNQHEALKMQSQYVFVTLAAGSVLLPAVLASAAAHMSTMGLLSPVVALGKNERALREMSRSMRTISNQSLTINNRATSTKVHEALRAIKDDTVAASIVLVGSGVIQGHELSQILPLIRGSASLIREWYHYLKCTCVRAHPARRDPNLGLDRKMYQIAARMLANFDIMSCVPCARAPILQSRYWFDDLHSELTSQPFPIPDTCLGYCGRVYTILGESASLIEKLYTTAITPDTFAELQDHLLSQLGIAASEIPPLKANQPQPPPPPPPPPAPPETDSKQSNEKAKSPTVQSDAEKEIVETHNGCVSSAIAHMLAAKIFLLRAVNHDQSSPRIRQLAEALELALNSISLDSTALNIILWPLLVLGCESYAGDERRKRVTDFFDRVFEKLKVVNIKTCQDVVEKRIWKLGSLSSLSPTSVADSGFGEELEVSGNVDEVKSSSSKTLQAAWVRYCWQERIEIMLA